MLPSFTIDFTPLREFFVALAKEDVKVEAGVGVEGSAAAYALVWEFGNIRQTKPGPKTVLGTNPKTGEVAFFSTQAPHGYVRVLLPLLRKIMMDECARMTFTDLSKIESDLKATAIRITQRFAELISAQAPKDSGDLRSQIKPILPGDSLLKTVAEGLAPGDYVLEMSNNDYNS
jgi:hypothetical protein